MSELLDKIRTDWLNARKNRDSVKSALLGTLVSQVETERKSRPADAGPILDSHVSTALRSFLKKAEEMREILVKSGNRETDLVKTNQEIALIKSYLPEQIDEKILGDEIAEQRAAGKNTGQIMQHLKAKFDDAVDMKMASGLVKQAMNS